MEPSTRDNKHKRNNVTSLLKEVEQDIHSKIIKS